LYEVMTREAKRAEEDIIVAPRVGTGFTDSHVFRRWSVTAYGFIPVLSTPEDQGRVHGNDERVTIENLKLGVQIIHQTVRGICGHPCRDRDGLHLQPEGGKDLGELRHVLRLVAVVRTHDRPVLPDDEDGAPGAL